MAMDNAVSRALHTYDIVHEILDALCDRDLNDISDKRRALGRLAQTSQMIATLVLPRLWRDLPSLNPLLHLLAPLRRVRTRIEERRPQFDASKYPAGNRGYSWV